MALNNVVLSGNLTKDVEVKSLGANGTKKANLSLAVNRNYKKGDDWVKETMYVDVDAWQKLAESVDGLKKGTGVVVSGSLRQDSWEDKEGKKRTVLKVNADSILVTQNTSAAAKPIANPDNHPVATEEFEPTPF